MSIVSGDVSDEPENVPVCLYGNVMYTVPCFLHSDDWAFISLYQFRHAYAHKFVAYHAIVMCKMHTKSYIVSSKHGGLIKCLVNYKLNVLEVL